MNKKHEKNSSFFKLLWYSHPRIAIAFTLLGLNLLVIIIFTIILAVVSGNGFFDELAYLFTYTMCSDGIYDFVNNDEDLTCFIIKIVLTIIQMVIFSGALIGFTTDILQSAIDNRLQNTGKLNLNNHYVFLNWSSIGPNIVFDLSYLEGKKVIVILSNKDKDEIMNSIQNIFTENDRKMKDLRIFIKNGDPSSVKHLSDVSIDTASHIGILLPSIDGEASETMSIKDLAVFKLLINTISLNDIANIVVEVEDNEAALKIEKFIELSNKNSNRISAVSHNSLIGHILGQTVVNPTYAQLYHDLLSYDGSELYAIPTMDIETALYKYNDCIPIINYDNDCIVDENGNISYDNLYILSDDEGSLGERTELKSFVKPLAYEENIKSNDFTVIIISNSNRVKYLTEEFDALSASETTKVNYVSYSFEENIETLINNINKIEGKKKILLLSSEKDDESVQDAYVFISLLSLRLNGTLNKDVEIFVEIINPKNLTALKELGVASAIVTNKIISLYIVQLITHPDSKRFFNDIIMTNSGENAGDIDFKIVKAKELLQFEQNYLEFSCYSEFVQSFYIASSKSKMCIGIKHDGANEIIYLCDKMDQPNVLKIGSNDELVYVDYGKK